MVHTSALIFLFLLIPKIIVLKELLVVRKNILKIIPYFVILLFILYYFLNINPFYNLYQNIFIKFVYYLQDDYYVSNGTTIRILLFLPSIYILSMINLDFFKKSINLEIINLLKVTGAVMLITVILALFFRGSLNFAFVDRIFIGLIFFQVIISNKYYEHYKLTDHVIVDLIIYLFPLIYITTWVNFSRYSGWWVPYKSILFF